MEIRSIEFWIRLGLAIFVAVIFMKLLRNRD